MDQSGGQAGKVGDVVEQELGSFIHLLLVAALTNNLDLGVVRAGDELLQICQTVGLGKGKDKLCLNEGLPGLLASHLQIAYQILKVTCRKQAITFEVVT